MQIQLISDTHTEFLPRAGWENSFLDYFQINPFADLIVLAGDIGNGDVSLQLAIELAQTHGKPVVWTPGNHEYYGLNYATQYKKYANSISFAETMGVFPLLGSAYEWNGITIIGATLWTDFQLYRGSVKMPTRSQAIDYAIGRLNDFNVIEGFEPKTYLEEHLRELKLVQTELAKVKDRDVLLVTHHGVHQESIAGKYRPRSEWLNSPTRLPGENDAWKLNPAFSSHLPELLQKPVKVGVHGHTHTSLDYMVGEVRVVANPCGYPIEVLNQRVYLENKSHSWSNLIQM